VRGLRASGRAADDVARADPARFVAVAQRALALHDEEHLLLGAMTVERARALAGRDDVVRIAEVLGSKQRPDAHGTAFEAFALGEVLELQLVEVDDQESVDAYADLTDDELLQRLSERLG